MNPKLMKLGHYSVQSVYGAYHINTKGMVPLRLVKHFMRPAKVSSLKKSRFSQGYLIAGYSVAQWTVHTSFF